MPLPRETRELLGLYRRHFNSWAAFGGAAGVSEKTIKEWVTGKKGQKPTPQRLEEALANLDRRIAEDKKRAEGDNKSPGGVPSDTVGLVDPYPVTPGPQTPGEQQESATVIDTPTMIYNLVRRMKRSRQEHWLRAMAPELANRGAPQHTARRSLPAVRKK